MWETFSNLTSLVTGQEEDGDPTNRADASAGSGQMVKVSNPSDLEMQMMQQEMLIHELKEMIRDRDRNLTDKEKELKKVSAELSKYRLKSKATIAGLKSRMDQSQKTMSESMERASVGSDESVHTLASEVSSTATGAAAEQKSRARVLLLQRQLKDKDQKLAEKDAIIRQKQEEVEAKERVVAERESAARDVSTQLAEQTNLVEHLRSIIRETTDSSGAELTTKKQLESRIEEMIMQMAHKDSRIMELSGEVTDKDKAILDLQEHIAEKNEVIRGRDQAIQLLKSLGSQESAGSPKGQGQRVASMEEEMQKLREQLEKKQTEAGEAEKQLKIMDEVMQTMQQKLLEANDRASARDKMVERLRGEIEMREKGLEEMRQALDGTVREMDLIKQNCAAEEARRGAEERQVETARVQESTAARIESEHLAEALKQSESAYGSLTVDHASLRQSHADVTKALEAAVQELSSRDSRIEELQAKLDAAAGAVATPDPKLAKFKALAGSKIKALERQVEELKQNATLADEVTALRNHVAELEEEKGNLQLQLLELEETAAKQATDDDQLILLRRQIDELQARCCDLEETNADQHAAISHLKATSDDEEMRKKERMNETLQKAVEDFQLLLEAERRQTEDREQEHSETVSKLEKMHSKQDRQRMGTIERLQVEFEEMKSMNQRLSSAEAELLKDLQDKELTLKGMESTGALMTSAFTAEETKVLDLTRALDTKDAEIQRLMDVVSSQQGQLSDYEVKEEERAEQEAKALQARDAEIRRLNEIVKDVREQLSDYCLKEQEMMNVARMTSDDKDSEIQSLNDMIKTQSEKLRTLEAKEQRQSAHLAETVQLKDSEIERLSERVDMTTEQLLGYEKKVGELAEWKKDAETENESLRRNVLDKDEKLLKLMSEMDSLVADVQSLRSKVEESSVREQELVMKLVSLEEQSASQDQLISSAKETISEKESALEAASTKFQEKETELEKLSMKLNEKEAELAKLSLKVGVLNESIEQTKSEKGARISRESAEVIEALQKELEDTQSTRRQLEDRVRNLEGDSLERKAEMDKMINDAEKLGLEIESLTQQLRNSEDLVLSLERKVVDRERKVESLTENLGEEEAQLVSLTEELEALRDQLDKAAAAAAEELGRKLIEKDEEIKSLSEQAKKKKVPTATLR